MHNWIDSVLLAVLVAITSFRVNGTFVIKTVCTASKSTLDDQADCVQCVKESFDGVDLVCILWTSVCLLDLFGHISLDKLFEVSAVCGCRHV